MKDIGQIDLHKFPEFMTRNPELQFHMSEYMTIVSCNNPTYILAGNYSHLNYEFFIAMTDIRGLTIEDQSLFIPVGMICPISSCQPHGALEVISDVRFMSIQFERRFFERLMQTVYRDQNYKFGNTLFAVDHSLNQLIRCFINELESQDAGSHVMLEGVAVQIGVWILRKLAAVDSDNPGNSPAFAKIDTIINIMKQQFETDFSLSKLSKSTNINKYTLIEHFKNHTGMTPYEYYQHNRIIKSLDLLRNSNYKIIEIAFHCGFKNHSHFSKVFRSKTRMTPSEYRSRYQ